MKLINEAVGRLVPPKPVYTVELDSHQKLKLRIHGSVVFNGTPSTPIEKLVLSGAKVYTGKDPSQIAINGPSTATFACDRLCTLFQTVAAAADKKAYPTLYFWTKRNLMSWTLNINGNSDITDKLVAIFNYGASVSTGGTVSYDPAKTQQLIFMLDKVKTYAQAKSRDWADETDPDKAYSRRRRRRK